MAAMEVRRAHPADADAIADVWLRSRAASIPAIPPPVHDDADVRAWSKRERPEGIKLWTFAANVGARRFYERHGFVAIDATAGDNEEGAPDVCYEWVAP